MYDNDTLCSNNWHCGVCMTMTHCAVTTGTVGYVCVRSCCGYICTPTHEPPPTPPPPLSLPSYTFQFEWAGTAVAILRSEGACISSATNKDDPTLDHLAHTGMALDRLDEILTFYAMKAMELPPAPDIRPMTPSTSALHESLNSSHLCRVTSYRVCISVTVHFVYIPVLYTVCIVSITLTCQCNLCTVFDIMFMCYLVTEGNTYILRQPNVCRRTSEHVFQFLSVF